MSSKNILFLVVSLFFVLIFFTFNVKSLLFVFTFIYGLIILLTKFNFFDSSVIIFFLSLPFENSIRQWNIYASPTESFDNYFLYYGITPKIIFGLIVLIQLLLQSKSIFKTKISNKRNLLIIIFLLLSVITSLFFQDRFWPVLTGLSRIFLAVFIYIISQTFFANSTKKYIFYIFIICLTSFCVFFGLNQFIHQKSLGKFIELTPSFSKTGYTTTDGKPQYRVSGFISHPVYFGSIMSILIPTIIGFLIVLYQKKIKYWKILVYLIIFSVIVTIATLSRSTWINLFIIFVAFYKYIKHHKLKTIFSQILKTKINIPIAIVMLIILIPLVSILSTRIQSVSSLVSDPNGSLGLRLKLTNIGFKLGLNRPLTGIGLNNYPFEAKIQGFSPDFSAPPHNTIFTFFTELGLPTTIIFILFLINLLWPKSNPFLWSSEKFGIWLGLLTFIVSSQFHFIFNVDPTLDIFMFISGYFSINEFKT